MHKADLHHSNPSLQRKLEKIFQLRRTRSAVNWDHENYLDLLQHFGNPHKDLPPVIHVAGTNGKGSVIAMLRAICEEAGLSVHAYTSPHLMHVNERIVLAGKQIGDDRLEALIDKALAYVGDKPLSFFEIISAVAFKAFCETPADILLLEVGMGGTLDCTNVIDDPMVSIINSISLDHTQFLGDAIEDIAAQKAGIMRQGVPCVFGYQGGSEQGKAVTRVVQQEAQQRGASLHVAGQGGDYPLLALVGEHQCHNADVAIEVIEQIKAQGLEISDEDISKGLQSCEWPGRLQCVSDLWPGGVEGHEIWLDCGHNDSAGEALAAQIERWNSEDGRLTYLVVGMLGSKDSKGFLRPMSEAVSSVYVVPISSDSTAQSAEFVRESMGNSVLIKSQSSCEEAVDEIIGASVSPVRILIAGSVYLAGEVLQFINTGESR